MLVGFIPIVCFSNLEEAFCCFNKFEFEFEFEHSGIKTGCSFLLRFIDIRNNCDKERYNVLVSKHARRDF